MDTMKTLMPTICVAVTFILSAGCLENLAQLSEYKGSPSMSSDYKDRWPPDKAVDGQVNPGQDEESCSFTNSGGGKKAWWKFPLKLMSNLAYLEIYFRSSTVNRHTGFSVYVFNDTAFIPPSNGSGFKIYTQNSIKCPSQSMTVHVNKEAMGVALFNSKDPPVDTTCTGYQSDFASIEICEVKVMGCPAGHFGNQCKFCGNKCLGGHCDVLNGSCTFGCSNPRMESPDCNVCKNGFYGATCTQTCGKCSTGTTCNKITGICLKGCQEHWDGDKCNICKRGFYGPDCTGTCGKCKTGTFCHNITGVCSQGCQEHWHGNKCDVCKDDYFGHNCEHACGKCKSGTHCNNITGICPEGCRNRWSGSECDVCKEGFYGTSCENACGSCANGTYCNNITGICTDGCQSHWNGTMCDVCENGFFGPSCNQECRYCNKNTCNKANGHCLLGCQGKRKGVKCDSLSLPLEGGSGGVIGGVVTILIILIVLVICVAIFVRRRFNMSKDSKEIGVSSVNSDKECKITYRKQSNMSSNSSQASLQVQLPSLDSADDSQYYNTSQISTDIRIDELQNVIASKSEGKENLFLLEYQSFGGRQDFHGGYYFEEKTDMEKFNITNKTNSTSSKLQTGRENVAQLRGKRLPSKDENKCNAAKKKENVTKNRFKTTFPYDHSRVILEEKWDGHDNDYINASYIKDCDGERRFIAAQGPQKNTLKDFWRVIWQENIGCIIMLTNLVENGKNKCTKYWPGRNQPMTSGPCKVSLLEETTYAFYTIRQFSIQRKKSEEVRTINQFHYTAWPDHGTPGEIELNQFHRTVKKKYQPGLPLLVHCSAGVGRTGTYIGLNVLLQQGRETGRINVFEFVKQMREDRMTMVQTVEQYVFLHKALLCGFQEKDVILSERDFQTKVLTLLNDTSPFNQQTLANEFQFVSVFKTVDDNGSKEDAKKLENMAKNVDMDILPVTKYRPYLTTYVKGRNDYINAVIAPTFTNQNGFIMTQKPLLDTEVDLWRLCMDHGVTALIVLNDTDEGNSWLPNRGETRHCQPFTITAKDTGSDINGVLQDRLLISNSGQKAHVDIYQTSSGNDEALVKCAKMLLEKENASTSTSLVVSKNGAGPAGIFCVLHNAIQQLRIDGEVDIFTRVRQMQTRRPEVITTLEEYRKCYHLVSRSVSSEEIYDVHKMRKDLMNNQRDTNSSK